MLSSISIGIYAKDISMGYRELPLEEQMPPAFHEWLRWLPLQEDKPPTTVRAYSQGFRRLVSFAEIQPEHFRPDSFGQAEITDAVRTMRSSGEVSRATLNQTLAAAKSFFDYCVADLGVGSVPDIGRIRKVSQLAVEQSEPTYYSGSEIRDLYRVAATEIRDDDIGGRVRWAERDFAMVTVLAALGLRAAELYSIDLDWITQDLLNDNNHQVLRVLGKGSKVRRLPLSKELLEVLNRWLEVRSERFGDPMADDPLFVTKDGERFNYRRLRYWLLTLNRAAGLRDRSLHSLRHTAGVQWAANGVPMNEIQSLLGHASINTTGIYTEVAARGLIDAVKASEANRLISETLREMDK